LADPKKDKQQDPYIGKQIGRFRLEARIARDIAPLVYKAVDCIDRRNVVLYLLTPDFIKANRSLSDYFIMEARAAIKVAHPAIPEILEAAESEGCRFVATRPAEGVTVASLMSTRGVLSVDEAVSVALEIARALQASHASGVIHREIWPGVILISPEGRAVLLRLGVLSFSRRYEDDHEIGPSEATAFWAPERYLSQTADGRCDIFSLGVTLFYMLTGKLPFTGTVGQIRGCYGDPEVSVPFPRKVDKRIPKHLDSLVHSMIAVQPDARPEETALVIAELERVAGEVTAEVAEALSPEIAAIKDEASELLISAERKFARLRSRVANRRVMRALTTVMVLMGCAVLATTVFLYLKDRAARVPKPPEPNERERVLAAKRLELASIEQKIGKVGTLAALARLDKQLNAFASFGGLREDLGRARTSIAEQAAIKFEEVRAKARASSAKRDFRAARVIYVDARRLGLACLEPEIAEAMKALAREEAQAAIVKPPKPDEPPMPVDPVPALLRRLADVDWRRKPLDVGALAAKEGALLAKASYVKGGVVDWRSQWAPNGVIVDNEMRLGIAEGGRELVVHHREAPVLIWHAPAMFAEGSASGKSEVKGARSRNIQFDVNEELAGVGKISSKIVFSRRGTAQTNMEITYTLGLSKAAKGRVKLGVRVRKGALSANRALVVTLKPFKKRMVKKRPLSEAVGKGQLHRLRLTGNYIEVAFDMGRWYTKKDCPPLLCRDAGDFVDLVAEPTSFTGVLKLSIELQGVKCRGKTPAKPGIPSWPEVRWPDLVRMQVTSREEMQKGQSAKSAAVELLWSGSDVEVSLGGKTVGRIDAGGNDRALLETIGDTFCLHAYSSRRPGGAELFLMPMPDGLRLWRIWAARAKPPASQEKPFACRLSEEGFGGWVRSKCAVETESGFPIIGLPAEALHNMGKAKLSGRNLRAVLMLERTSPRVGATSLTLAGKTVVLVRGVASAAGFEHTEAGRMAIVFTGPMMKQK